MKDSEVPEGEGAALTTLRDHGLGPMSGDMGLTPFSQGEVTQDCELGDGELPTESGGKSSDTPAEPALASTRWIRIPESPTSSGSPAFHPVMEDSGQSSNSFVQQCASSKAPECVSGNYDSLSYDLIHNLRKDRGYH